MITRVEAGQTYTQAFDAENRLISVTVNSQMTQFVYDGDGNLVKKINPDGSKTLHVGADWAAYGAQEIVYSGSDKEADPIILVHLVFPNFGK